MLARETVHTTGPKDPSPLSHVALVTNGSCRGGAAASGAVREVKGAGLGGWDRRWAGLGACALVSEKRQPVPSPGGLGSVGTGPKAALSLSCDSLVLGQASPWEGRAGVASP